MGIDKTKRGTAISANVPFALAQAVYAQVKNNSHASAGAVVRAALRLYLRLDDDDQPLPEAETPPIAVGGKRRPRNPRPEPADED